MSLNHLEDEMIGLLTRIETMEQQYRREKSGVLVPMTHTKNDVHALRLAVEGLTNVVEGLKGQVEQLNDLVGEAGIG